jgi:hypothetical protein
MKKLFFLFAVILIANNLLSQVWQARIDSSVFDGITKICGTQGISNDQVYTSPFFQISHNIKTDAVYFYLSNMPYGGCDTGFWPIKLKFDNEEETYQLGTLYLNASELYVLNFVSDKVMQSRPNQHLISLKKMVEKLTTKNIMYLRYQSSCVLIDIKFLLDGASDEIEKVLKVNF